MRTQFMTSTMKLKLGLYHDLHQDLNQSNSLHEISSSRNEISKNSKSDFRNLRGGTSHKTKACFQNWIITRCIYGDWSTSSAVVRGHPECTYNFLRPISSRVAQRKRAGPITQRSEDRNLPLLYKFDQSASRMFFVQPMRSLPCFLMKVFVTRGINEENFHQTLKLNLIDWVLVQQ